MQKSIDVWRKIFLILELERLPTGIVDSVRVPFTIGKFQIPFKFQGCQGVNNSWMLQYCINPWDKSMLGRDWKGYSAGNLEFIQTMMVNFI